MAILSRARFLIAILAVGLAGVGLSVWGAIEFYTSVNLRVRGVKVPGQVIDGRTQGGSRSGQTYYLTVSFERSPGDGPTHREFEVSRARFDRRLQSPDAQVRILPDDPEAAQFVGEESNGFLPIGIGAWFLLASGFMFRVFLKNGTSAVVAPAKKAEAKK